MSLEIQEYFDRPTFTLTYIVYDKVSKDAIIIDPVLNYVQGTSTVSYDSIDELVKFLKQKELKLKAVLETHAHADHLSGAYEIRSRLPDVQIVVSDQIDQVQNIFGPLFNTEIEENAFDVLVADEQVLDFGTIKVKSIHTPGHTPACVSYLIEENVFTGDTLFMPDFGTGRCDFPAGDAKKLFNSVSNKLYGLSGSTKVYTGHDYMPGGRELRFQSTIEESKNSNIHITSETSEEEFVEFRTNRDKKLAAPKLLLPSIQVNINAGKLPKAEENGKQYLKLPINI